MAASNPGRKGTKVAAYYVLNVPAGEERQVYLRLTDEKSQPTGDPFGLKFQEVFQSRLEEADDFYDKIIPSDLGPQQKLVDRQAYAGKGSIVIWHPGLLRATFLCFLYFI